MGGMSGGRKGSLSARSLSPGAAGLNADDPHPTPSSRPDEEARDAVSGSDSGPVPRGWALGAESEPLGGALFLDPESVRPQVAHEAVLVRDADGSWMQRGSVQVELGRQLPCCGRAGGCPFRSSPSWRCAGPEPCIMAVRRRCPGRRAVKRNLVTSSTVQRRVSGKSRWRAARYVSRCARSESGPLHIGSSHRRSVHSRRHNSPGYRQSCFRAIV
mmetsp:Transcript_37594/g.78705  ORF Transcript_37594/g.78705 Transcript_37594/m.78705 type:complete len:215 (-) Transcript_37594:281-925(-)